MAKKTRQNPLSSKPNFSPLLSVLRTELGLDWGIYNEFLDEVQDAVMTGENLSPWINQIEPLIPNQAARFAHQGVLLLLKEMQRQRSAKDKRGAISKSPSPDADQSSPSQSGNGTEVPEPPSNQRSTTDSDNESTQMPPSNSDSLEPQASAPAPTAPVPSAARVSEEQSHTNTTQQQNTRQSPVLFVDDHFKRAVQEFFSGATPTDDTGTSIRP